jgi:hypothetical protein
MFTMISSVCVVVLLRDFHEWRQLEHPLHGRKAKETGEQHHLLFIVYSSPLFGKEKRTTQARLDDWELDYICARSYARLLLIKSSNPSRHEPQVSGSGNGREDGQKGECG